MIRDLNKKTYLLVTGASRGIGRTMAIELAKKIKANSIVDLHGRDLDRLLDTKSKIEACTKDLYVQVYCMDLSFGISNDYASAIQYSLNGSGKVATDFEQAFIVHNAGSVGDVSKRAREISDMKTLDEYYHINVLSMISLNAEFFKVFTYPIPKFVINISSKCALEPFLSMSMYCTAKAARLMYFRVLAAEEPEDTLVLNYSPGVIDTDMTIAVQQDTINPKLRESFKKQRDEGTMLTTEQTVAKFIEILEKKQFKSGDHIDYWDELNSL